jgi:hypothetical protein
MPPLFLLCPLRLMELPLTGRLPVIAQILAMFLVVKRLRVKGGMESKQGESSSNAAYGRRACRT